jgi:uncharacterized membrane protein
VQQVAGHDRVFPGAAAVELTVSFLTLLTAIDGVGVFFLFGFLTLVALAYFWRKVPETKGRSLHEIELQLTGKD